MRRLGDLTAACVRAGTKGRGDDLTYGVSRATTFDSKWASSVTGLSLPFAGDLALGRVVSSDGVTVGANHFTVHTFLGT